MPNKGQPFALVNGLWHALEWSRADKVLPENKMICGLVVWKTLEDMTSYGVEGQPDPTPWCPNCVERRERG